MKNSHVLIVGLGLIGGSVALAIKKEHPQCHISGYDVHKDTLKLAKVLQIIDEQANDLQAFAERAALIVLATPVQQTESWITTLAGWKLQDNVIVTDVGSTKKRIMNKSEELVNSGVTFIGGHPMAGSHKSGIQAAKVRLFENAFYLLTPYSPEQEERVKELQEWLRGTNAKFITLSAEEHDELTGMVSHFPHIIAASIVHQASNFSGNLDLLTRLAAGGFRDITRIASGNPMMWKDILVHNREVLLELLHSWGSETDRVIQLLDQANEDDILSFFQKAKDFRDALPSKSRGAIPAFYDLYVDVPDYPGVISEVTGYLAEEEISITNIRIMETREDLFGVLVISFQTMEDCNRAKACIERRTSFETFDSV